MTRWAVLGTGAIAARFADDMRHSRLGEIVAIGARRPERAAAFAAAIGPTVSSAGIEALLSREDIDAVYVATPNATHADLCLAAIAAGKPVLVEKPFALSAKEAMEVADAARAARILVMEAMWMRFTPGIVRLKQLVSDGTLGEIRRVEASVSFRHHVAPGSPFADPLAGGALLDLGVYPVSLAVHLLGTPNRVAATSLRLETGAVAASSLVLGYETALAALSCGFDAEGGNTAVVTGTLGVATVHRSMLCPPMISLRRSAAPSEAQDEAQSETPAPMPSASKPRLPVLSSLRALASGLKTARYPTVFEGSGLHYQADHVSQCLAMGLTESPVMPLDQSIAVLDIIDRAAAG